MGCSKILFLFPLFFVVVFVEKILRVQPNVKKLYLLLRAQDNNAALQRFNNEVFIYFLFVLRPLKFDLFEFTYGNLI